MNKAIITAINQKGRDAIETAYKENIKATFINRTITKGVWRFDRVSEDPLIIEAVLNPRFKTFVHNETAKENFTYVLEHNGATAGKDFKIEVL